jgi:hypothetical protein
MTPQAGQVALGFVPLACLIFSPPLVRFERLEFGQFQPEVFHSCVHVLFFVDGAVVESLRPSLGIPQYNVAQNCFTVLVVEMRPGSCVARDSGKVRPGSDDLGLVAFWLSPRSHVATVALRLEVVERVGADSAADAN